LSLGDIQETYALVKEINDLMTEVLGKTTSLDRDLPTIKESAMTLQEATRILFRFNHILSHMGLPENINQAIHTIQRFVFMVRMLEMSAVWLAGGTPYGAIMGALGVVSVMISSTELDARR
jgi:hypothetical protein